MNKHRIIDIVITYFCIQQVLIFMIHLMRPDLLFPIEQTRFNKGTALHLWNTYMLNIKNGIRYDLL